MITTQSLSNTTQTPTTLPLSGINSFQFFRSLGLLPRRGFVKVQLDGRPTWLEAVEGLQTFCTKHLDKKIAISYCAFQAGNQSSSGIYNPTARCIDLDCHDHQNGALRVQQVLPLRFIFPEAVVIWSNGVTLVFPVRGTWHEDALWCAEQGRLAEKLGWLHYDKNCHLLKDGTPGKHEGHLFRAPIGWAHKRQAPVMWWPPLSTHPTYDAESICRKEVA